MGVGLIGSRFLGSRWLGDGLSGLIGLLLVTFLTAIRMGSRLCGTEGDAGLGQVVRRHFNRHLVTGNNPDEMLAHFS